MGAHRILMLGDTGVGKTSQFLTLPGKKFAYLFDPNALLTIRGYDVDYEEFLPPALNLDVKSLTKDKGDRVSSIKGNDSYVEWEEDFESRIAEGFFADYDWICIDSATTFLDLIMDRVLTLNGRAGQWPQQDDYGPQMMTFTKVIRTLVGLGKGIYVTGHLKTDQDELTKKIYSQPMLTGQLRAKIPLLFSDCLSITVENDGQGNIAYDLHTVKDRMTPAIRCSIRGVSPVEDVTIDWSKPIEGQGLGRLIEESYL